MAYFLGTSVSQYQCSHRALALLLVVYYIVLFIRDTVSMHDRISTVVLKALGDCILHVV